MGIVLKQREFSTPVRHVVVRRKSGVMKKILQGIRYIVYEVYLNYVQNRFIVHDRDVDIDMNRSAVTATWVMIRYEQCTVTGVKLGRVLQEREGYTRQVRHWSVIRAYAFM